MGRSAPGAEARPHRGAVDAADETTEIGVAAHLSGADLRGGGASAAAVAGLSPETGRGETGLCPGTATTNLLGPSPGPGVAPGPTTGSDRWMLDTSRTGGLSGSETRLWMGKLFHFLNDIDSSSFSVRRLHSSTLSVITHY